MDGESESLVHDLWWMGVIQGAIAVFFGIAAIFWPGLTLLVLLWLFAAFLIIMGLAEIIAGLVSIGKSGGWWLTTLIGFLSLAVGVFLIRNPETTLQTFIIIAGLILIARGIVDAIRAFAGSEGTQHRVLTAIIGMLAILAGIAILAQPIAGGVAFVWILGLYALFYGALLMSISFSARHALDEARSSKR